MNRLMITAAAALVGLAACATGPRIPDEQRLELYRAHAGEPVGSFNYFRTLYGWTPLDDSVLAVWTRHNQAYLVDLAGPCQGLEYTPAISISHQFSRVYAGFDKVVVLNDPAFNIPCRISEIRPIDVDALEQAEEDLRERIEMVERSQSAEPGSDGGT